MNNKSVTKRKLFNLKSLSKRQEIVFYSSLVVFFITLVSVLSVVLSNVITTNINLEKEFQNKKAIYDELIQEQMNLQNEEYASVYYDDSNAYIPNNKIIIEYTNK